MTVEETAPIELSAGDLRLVVAPEIGGVAIGFWREGPDGPQHFLRPSFDAEHAIDSALYPLLPFAGRIGDARFSDPARGAVRLPRNFPPEPHAIHGVGWTAPWSCAKRGKAEARLTLSWPEAAASAEAAAGWPWRFEAALSYALDDKGLTVALSLRNEDQTAFFSGLGLHPFFPEPEEGLILLEAEGRLENGRDGLPSILGRPKELAALKAGAPVIRGLDHVFLAKGPALIAWEDRRVVLHALERLDGAEEGGKGGLASARWWVLYTPEGEDFFCVEPLTHQPDAHNGARAFVEDAGLRRLAPGATHHLFARFAVAV